jgi:hypothetical protein
MRASQGFDIILLLLWYFILFDVSFNAKVIFTKKKDILGFFHLFQLASSPLDRFLYLDIHIKELIGKGFFLRPLKTFFNVLVDT